MAYKKGQSGNLKGRPKRPEIEELRKALDQVQKKKGGRPTKYKLEFVQQAKKLCLLGATDEDLAVFFGVAATTIENWKKKYKGFLQSLKEAKNEVLRLPKKERAGATL